MPKLPRLTAADAEAILLNAGLFGCGQGQSSDLRKGRTHGGSVP